MSFNLSIYCPHCHRHTALSVAQVRTDHQYEPLVDAIYHGRDRWWIGVCNSCDGVVLVRENGYEIWPTPVPKPTDERVPEQIRSDLDEAKLCFQVSAYRGAAVMARRTIQQLAIDKGHSSGNLASQISEMANAGILTQDVREWANVVRWVGNDAAHPNDNAVEEGDAKDIIELAEQLFSACKMFAAAR